MVQRNMNVALRYHEFVIDWQRGILPDKTAQNERKLARFVLERL
jgi:hypothetical protein